MVIFSVEIPQVPEEIDGAAPGMGILPDFTMP